MTEFMYDLIYSADRGQRERVGRRYSKIFKNQRTAKAFCQNSSIEEKEYVMAMLGIKSFHIFADESITPKELSKILKLYKNGESGEALKQIVEKKIYIYSDKQFIDMLSKMADTEQHPQYSFNVELRKTGYHIKKWSRHINTKVHKQSVEITEYLDEISSLADNFMNSCHCIESRYSMKVNDMHILSGLYKFRHKHVPMSFLWDKYGGIMSKPEVSQAMRRLRNSSLVDISSITGEIQYIITGLGIETLNRFLTHVITQPNFNYAA